MMEWVDAKTQLHEQKRGLRPQAGEGVARGTQVERPGAPEDSGEGVNQGS